MKKQIFVRFEFEGFHKYPNAPEEVSFLRNLHRHIFKCKVTVDVFHDDRELEFFMVKHYLESKFKSGEDVNNKSCEMICSDIYDAMKKYGDPYYGHAREIEIEVSEDDENGAIMRSTI